MKKKITIIALLITSNILFSQKKNNDILLENEKIEEFTVSVFKGKDEFEAILKITKNDFEKPIVFKIQNIPYKTFNSLDTMKDLVTFEDFDFDGEKEIVIPSNNGIYLFDRKTGKTKDLFKAEEDRESGKKIKNFIFTYRGEYEKDSKEKTITIKGSSGAGSGTEQTYQVQYDGKMKLVKECTWDY